MFAFIDGRKILEPILFGVLMVVMVLTVQGYFAQRSMPKDQAPAVSGRLIDGEFVNLGALSQGKPVLLYFWANWCMECRAINSAVQKVAKDYPVLSVTMSSGSKEWLKQYMKARELSFPVLNDVTGTVSRDWGVTTVPSFVVVMDGKVRFITTGYTSSAGLRARLWLAGTFLPFAGHVMAWFEGLYDSAS